MPRYVIEREIPGAGKLTPDQLKSVAQKSRSVLQAMGPKIQWEHSYVAGDKIYCVYIAEDEAAIREHARRGEFPVNKVEQIGSIMDPTTAE
jgi:hypothetical protein